MAGGIRVSLKNVWVLVFDILMNLCRQFAKWHVTFLKRDAGDGRLDSTANVA